VTRQRKAVGASRTAALAVAALVLGTVAADYPQALSARAYVLPRAGTATDAAFFVPAAPAPPAMPAAPVIRVPGTIDRTGAADVTAALLAFLRRVPDGARVVFPPRSRYRVEGTLELTGRSRLVLDGSGSEFFATIVGDGQRAHWRLVGGSDLTLRQMTIRGPNPDGGTAAAFHDALQWQHGVDLRGVSRALIERVRVSDVYGDCVYLGLGPGQRWSSDIRVSDSQCARNGRQGVALTAARRVVVERNRLAQIALMTFDVEPNGRPGGAADVLISDNVVGTGPRQQFLGIVGRGPVARVQTERNVLRGKALTVLVTSLAGDDRSGIAVLENRSDTAHYDPDGFAMYVEGVRGLWVEGNVAPLSGPNMALVRLACTTSAVIRGNTYPGGTAQARRVRSECRPAAS
jgi:polygalacturonase